MGRFSAHSCGAAGDADGGWSQVFSFRTLFSDAGSDTHPLRVASVRTVLHHTRDAVLLSVMYLCDTVDVVCE